MKSLIVDLCRRTDFLRGPRKDTPRYNCVLFAQKMEKLESWWKLNEKFKASQNVESVMDEADKRRTAKLRDFLLYIQKCMSKNPDTMTDLEKWMINSLMTCNAELKIPVTTLSESNTWDEQVDYIRQFYADSVKETFKNIEQMKAIERQLHLRNQNVDRCVAKVIYYLRDYYLNRNMRCSSVFLHIVLEVLSGFDPEDKASDQKYFKMVHYEGRSCDKFGGPTSCQRRHYEFEALHYEKYTFDPKKIPDMVVSQMA